MKYFWQRNACLRVNQSIPQKSQKRSGGANLRVRCAVAWVPASFINGLEMSAFELPAAITISQLSGAPTSVMHHHPFSQRALPGSKRSYQQSFYSDSCQKMPQGHLCPWSGLGQVVWGWKEGGKKTEKKRDCCWRFRRTPKITSNVLNVCHFRWWHSHISSNWFFERLNYTRTK